MPKITILVVLFLLNACIVGTNDKKDQANLFRKGISQIDDVVINGGKNFSKGRTISSNKTTESSKALPPSKLPENFDPEDPSTWPEGVTEKNLKDHI